MALFLILVILDYEYAEQGIQAWNAGEGEYSFHTSLAFLLFDTILFLLLGWYLEQIMPRDFGTRRPFWFLVSTKFWCKCKDASAHSLSNSGSANKVER